MKKLFLVLIMIAYLLTIIILRKYPENHICSFLIGLSCALTVVFYIYMINIKNQHLKKK